MLGERPQRIDDFTGALDEHRAVADQLVASARERMMDRARNREHVAPLVARRAGRDQRARTQARFDDERAEREARDDPVAARKVVLASRRARRELADERAARLD